MVDKKRILVSLSSNIVLDKKSIDIYSFIRNSYLLKLNDLPFIPILVSGNMSKPIRDELYALCDGVLFPGGRDINPKFYKQKAHPKTQWCDTLRDEMEMDIVQRTLKDGKPFLGVCRGAQTLAVALGGTLIQYIPDVTNVDHGISDQELLGGKMITHQIQITPGTKVHKIFGTTQIEVPSKHNQAIDDPGELIISGRAKDGIVEIVEHPKALFHIGVQFHPEASSILDKLYLAFYKAIDTYQHSSK